MDAHAAAVERWEFWYWLWGCYVVVGLLTTAVLVLVTSETYPGNRWAALAALAGLQLWCLVLPPRRRHPEDFFHRAVNLRSVAFVGGALVLFFAAVVSSPAALAAIMVVFALIYMTLPVRAALVAAAVVSCAPVVAVLATGRWEEHDKPWALGITIVALVFNPAIGASITMGIDRSEQFATLLGQLEQSRADVARLSREAGSAAERARLAREIHDTLAQGFTGIATLVQAVESELDAEPAAARRHIELIGATARENLTEARTMVEVLTPPNLSGGSLVESVRRRCERLTEETAIVVTLRADPEMPEPAIAVGVVLLRAAQEALANVRKHAAADSVIVELGRTSSGIRLSVQDNGRGFDPAESDGTGYGLAGMRSRAEQIGATVIVSTRPQAGTRVDVEVPA